jgi:hypothetical protein
MNVRCVHLVRYMRVLVVKWRLMNLMEPELLPEQIYGHISTRYNPSYVYDMLLIVGTHCFESKCTYGVGI